MSMFNFAGKYQLVKHRVDSDGNIIDGSTSVVLPWFDNLITNGGLDLLGGNGADVLTFCRIGTGNASPANTDTGLVTQTNSTNTAPTSDVIGADAGGSYVYRRVTRRFAAGTISGVNLAEVAMAPGGSGQVFSRALLKDTGGTPTTIVLSPDEVLDVVYELRCYISLSDVVSTATVDGVSTTVTIRKHGTLAGSGWQGFAALLGSPFWTTFSANNRNTLYALETQPSQATESGYLGNGDTKLLSFTRSYTNGSGLVKLTITAGLTIANFASGLGAVVMSGADLGNARGNGLWSWGFNPKLNKTASRTATIEIGLSFGRY